MNRFVRFSMMVGLLLMMLMLAKTSVSHAATDGTLNVVCDIRGAKPADQAQCSVSIDGVVQPATIAPGAKLAFKLAPGSHPVSVYVIGEAAWEWSPDFGVNKTVNIGAGYTRSLYATFLRKGKITLTLNQPNALADFYLNGEYLGTQLNSIEVLMTPAKSHVIEVRNIKDPTLTGDESWKETRLTTYVAPGAVKTITLKLQKQTGKGYLKVTCKIKNAPANETLFCLPTIDGVAVEQIPQNGSVTYTLTPGTHYYYVDVGPRSGAWILSTSTLSTPALKPGVTSNLTVTPTLTVCPSAWTVFINQYVCASGPATTTNAVIQYFEQGIMLWEQNTGAYAVMSQSPVSSNPVVFYSDPLNPQRDTSGSVGTPPSGLYAPVNGFGILWRGDNNNSYGHRNQFGWALAPESGYQMTKQCGKSTDPLRPYTVCYLNMPDGRLISFEFAKFWSWRFVN